MFIQQIFIAEAYCSIHRFSHLIVYFLNMKYKILNNINYNLNIINNNTPTEIDNKVNTI